MITLTYCLSAFFFIFGCVNFSDSKKLSDNFQAKVVFHNRFIGLGFFAIATALYIAAFYHS